MRLFFYLMFTFLSTVLHYASAAEKELIEVGEIATCTSSISTATSTSTPSGYFTNLMTTRYWPARWTCGTWSDWEGWLYISSDISIFLAYFSIPFILIWYIRKRDLGRAKWIVTLFIVFIGLCGFTHAIDALMFWVPVYRLSGFTKLLTGIASVGTAIVLGFVFPEALKYRSPADMQAEINKRRQLQELFELFVKHSPGAIAMFDMDMKYLMVNDNWIKDYGLDKEELIGRSHYDVFPSIPGMNSWKTFHQRALNGEIIKNDQDSFFHNGNEVFLRWQLHPWRTEKGKIGGIIMFTELITERVQLKEELEENKKTSYKQLEVIEDISDVAKIGTWNMFPEANLVEWSSIIYDIHEMERGAAVDYETVLGFYHPQDRIKLQKAIKNTLSAEATWDLELRLVLGEKEKWVRAIGQPLYDKGIVIGLDGLLQDIDVSKRTEASLTKTNQQLALVNEELGAFTYSVSHDLRAPLRIINGFSETLKEDFHDILPDEGKRFLSRIVANSQKMGKLIDDLLAFSRMTRREEKPTQLDLNTMIRELVNEVFSDSVNFISISPLPQVYGDQSMIRQVLQNLISNAVKYSRYEKKPQIEIGSYEQNQDTVIYVKDNGVGFDDRFISKLFGIFQRLHGEEEFEGTGVGLALCQKIISRHNGKIWAESQLGEGATFFFSLKNSR